MTVNRPFHDTDAELLDDVRERLLAMVGLPHQLGTITRRRLADICQIVGLRISRSEDRFWLILRPGEHHPEPLPALERVLPVAVQPGRYEELIVRREGSERDHYFLCRECGPGLDPYAPGARLAGWWDRDQETSVHRIVVTDRFLHDGWHGQDPARDRRLAETVTLLFDEPS